MGVEVETEVKAAEVTKDSTPAQWLALLDEGDDVFCAASQARGQREMMDLSGLDLRGRDLTKVGLFRADLRGAKLAGAKVTSHLFISCYLDGVDCSELEVAGDHAAVDAIVALWGGLASWNAFRAAHQSLPLLHNACLRDLDARGFNLRRTDFTGAFLCGARLDDCDLRETHFYEASLVAASLNRADLSLADLRCADLSDSHAQEATLFATQVMRSKLNNADWSRVSMTDVSVIETEARDLRLDGATLVRGGFIRCDLQGASLRDIKGEGLSFAYTRLVGADLSGAVIPEDSLAAAVFDPS